MQNREKNQIKVGMFVFAGLILAMYIIFMLGGEKQIFRPHYWLKTSLKDISGLRQGAPVQLAGLKVGFVDKIKFPQDLSKKEIELTLRIDKKFQDRIRSDSTAMVNTQGLLGDKFIFVSIGSEDQPILTNGGYLESRESVGLGNVVEKSSEIMADIRDASKSIKKFFEDMYASKEDVRSVLHSMKGIMGQAQKGDGLLHAMLYDPKGKETVADIAASMNMLKDIIGRANKADKESGEVSGVLKNLRSASKDLKEIVAKVNRGEGTIGGLISDPALYNDLRSLFGRANRNKLLKAVIRSTLSENEKK